MAAGDPYKYFRIEARELVEGLGRGVLRLEKGGADHGEVVASLLRLAHTLKGAARVVRQLEIAELSHAVEDLLEPHRERPELPVAQGQVDLLLAKVDAMAGRLAALDGPPATAAAAATATATAARARRRGPLRASCGTAARRARTPGR
jgi:two-component system chemotaxis sensor kinase CheA